MSLTYSSAALAIDVAAATHAIERSIREQVITLRRRGVVVALSGGIDSSVVTALCARALSVDRVFVLLMPERYSSAQSTAHGQMLAESLGINAVIEDITGILEAAGCYTRQQEAIRLVFPEYGEGYRHKITLPSLLVRERLNVFELTILTPTGESKTARMPPAAYLQLVAATNFKQRVRKMLEYYHADRLNYAVAGTPNRLEYDQGFFVKLGDGAADLKPIAHLYKTQVFALAAFLKIPEPIRQTAPTTDTYSIPQTQEEFYFALPYHQMDLCLYGFNHGIPEAEIARAAGLTAEQVSRVLRDIEQKRRATQYLHARPLLTEPVPEISG